MKRAVTFVVQKYWLTGVLPAFRDGVSPLSATQLISMLPEYHGLCGLTDDEVRSIAAAYSGSPKPEDEMLEIRRSFNGYRFCLRSEDLPTLYNPQQVFTHLQTVSPKGGPFSLSDEANATHSGHVMDSIRGVNILPEFFMNASNGNLNADVMKEFGPSEMQQFGSDNTRLAQSLLYYFGVFTFRMDPKRLVIPNASVRHLVSPQDFSESCASAYGFFAV